MIVDDHGVRANSAIGTNLHRAQHLRTGTNGHAVTNGRVTLHLLQGTTAQGHAVVQHHVVTNLSGLTNHNAHAMIDKEAAANGRAGVNLHTGQKTRKLRKGTSQRLRLILLPELMGQTVNPNGVHTRIVQRNLDSAARSRIVLADVLNIFTQTRNKTHGFPFPHRSRSVYATFPKVPTTGPLRLFPPQPATWWTHPPVSLLNRDGCTRDGRKEQPGTNRGAAEQLSSSPFSSQRA